MLLKLVVLLIAVGAAWYGFKLIARRGARHVDGANPKALEVNETVRCRVCDTYVAPSLSGSCGRADCPY